MKALTNCIVLYCIELLFYLGKPLAMRLLHKAPRTVQAQVGEKKRKKKKEKKKKACTRNNRIK